MAEKKPADQFAQLAYLTCVESAANTLTFAKLDIATGALLGEKKYGMVIQRIQYQVTPGSLAFLNGTGDFTKAAICVSPNISTIDLESPEVVDNITLVRLDIGTAASGMILELPVEHNFVDQGGLLVPADKLYLAVSSSGASAAVTFKVRVHYTMKELTIADYWDLVETRRIIST